METSRVSKSHRYTNHKAAGLGFQPQKAFHRFRSKIPQITNRQLYSDHQLPVFPRPNPPTRLLLERILYTDEHFNLPNRNSYPSNVGSDSTGSATGIVARLCGEHPMGKYCLVQQPRTASRHATGDNATRLSYPMRGRVEHDDICNPRSLTGLTRGRIYKDRVESTSTWPLLQFPQAIIHILQHARSSSRDYPVRQRWSLDL